MTTNKKLKIAIAQFLVTGDISKNSKHIKRLIREAAANKADIIQFPETALCGWGKWNNPSFKKFNFEVLRKENSVIRKLATEKKIWTILGSAHRLGSDLKPTNCLYVIDNKGRVADRYDKCWLVQGDELKTFTPGNHLVTFALGGVRCGLMICYDGQYLQMLNAYAHKGVELLFYSAGHAGFKHQFAKIEQAAIPSYAVNFKMWIAVSNSSSRYSGLITCVADPNGMGTISKTLKRHETGVVYHTLTNSSFKDCWNPEVKLAKLHPKEIYHNGKPSRHPRALNRASLP